jgi:hypothetical protein
MGSDYVSSDGEKNKDSEEPSDEESDSDEFENEILQSEGHSEMDNFELNDATKEANNTGE